MYNASLETVFSKKPNHLTAMSIRHGGRFIERRKCLSPHAKGNSTDYVHQTTSHKPFSATSLDSMLLTMHARKVISQLMAMKLRNREVVLFASGVSADVVSHRCGGPVSHGGVGSRFFGQATDPTIEAIFYHKSLRRAVIEHVNNSRL